ncbi:MAG: hypothetical protein JSW47_08825 [Phycisphaerales bacterium]|nr:MAG: hypothetical protein JSW47_08825 [Phycisphaerales bacterium]
MDEWKGAAGDIDKGGGMLRDLIAEGQRHHIASFLQKAGFRCAFAEQLGDLAKAATWANDAMQWFVEEVCSGRGNEMLVKAAEGFAGVVGGNVKVLLKNRLDEELWESFRQALKEAGG